MRASDREVWTAFIEGRRPKQNKYGNRRTRAFASDHEAEVAGNLAALEKAGKITKLKYQVPFVLVYGDGKTRPIKYVADFTYFDEDGDFHIGDAKGAKTAVYRLKKKMMWLLLDLEIEEL